MKIADKIVTVILSVSAIFTAIFSPLVHIIYKITGWDILQSTLGIAGQANDVGLTEDNFSIYWFFQQINKGILSFNGSIDTSKMDERVAALLPYIKWTVMLFAAGTVISLVLIVLCIVSRAKKTQCIVALAGIGTLSACGILFSKFASPIIDGSVTVGTLADSLLGGVLKEHQIIKLILSSIVDIQQLNLTTAWSLQIIIFAAIIIWNISYLLTLPKDESVKMKRGKA